MIFTQKFLNLRLFFLEFSGIKKLWKTAQMPIISAFTFVDNTVEMWISRANYSSFHRQFFATFCLFYAKKSKEKMLMPKSVDWINIPPTSYKFT